ncbi:MAG: tRNA (N(6)-L-threonylcarbamoyladenosine(37)-C(2))-methylthiotransferase MtaB [Armatimonadetes bacterium]|nr:tRNA (N(6)-L-threonylcarbamoyladenosine(37)-C(2))-methylthiotransferase MtaB [Armatimonadota bacterium]
MPAAAYYTLGCKVNQYETEKIREELDRLGFSTVNFASQADVYVINSCTVTGMADAKSRRAIRQAARRNPNAFVVATGCYAELEPAQVGGIEGVDLVVGNDQKESIPERLVARFPNLRRNGGAGIRPRTRTRAIVKIQDGCNQFCAYCAVAYARSRQWSREISDVVEEISTLAGFGYREIVLTGIRLGSYAFGLPALIRSAAEVDGIERIRLSSIEVWEVDEELLRTIAENPKACRHLHMPLQSGDDGVLKLMRRPYAPDYYARTVEKAREMIPELGLTTDVMVGFPGETDDAFQRSYEFVRDMGFSRLHVFRYSPRPGTAAASFSDRVPEAEKSRRSELMIELGTELADRFAGRLVGQTVDVLAEPKRGEFISGFTDNYVEVRFLGGESLRGRIVPVRVESATADGVIASLASGIGD